MKATVEAWTTKARGALTRVPRPPLVLAAIVLAALAFVGAYLIGRSTAATQEDLRAPAAVSLQRATPMLVVLGRAAPLPAAPKRPKRPKRAGSLPKAPASSAPASSDGKLIVGSG